MVGKRIVVDAVIDLRVGVAGSLCTKLPYRPLLTMFRVKELDERVERIPVGALGIGSTGTRCGNDCASSARRNAGSEWQWAMYCCP